MSNISDTATVTLVCNGSQAKKELTELQQKFDQAAKRVDELQSKIKDKDAFNAAKESVDEYSNELSSLKSKLKNAEKEFKDLKDTAGTSPADLKKAREAVKTLKNDIQTTSEALRNAKNEFADFDPKTLEKAKKKASELKKRIDDIRSSTETVKDVLSNLDSVSLKQLQATLQTLNKQFRNAEQGTEAYTELAAKIRAVKEQIASVKDDLKETEGPWARFKNWAVGAWPALDLLKGWYDDAINTLRGFVDAYAGMDQEMQSVRKYTGMATKDVDALNEEFKKMDTRTSREQLNLLAQDAGRLGKHSVDDIMGFVRAADKINVALDDLGDGATLTLSKLTGVFGVEDQYGTEKSLLKVGSVINELSQNCSASAPYIANFTERVAGVGVQANMTIPQIMGFAAVLDSNAQKVEASATAVSQVLVRLYQDPAKYAKVAGLDVKEFSDLLQKDANGALILLLETLNKAGGMDVLSPMFKDMGENGSRAIAALSTLADKIEDVKAQQEVAAEAFREGTSIDAEFEVQNNTIAASLDKCKNAAHEYQVELGERLYPLMSHFLSSAAAVSHALLIVLRYLFDHKAAVLSLAVAITTYTLALKILKANITAAAIQQSILNAKTATAEALTASWTVVTKLAAAALALLTGNVTKARVAWNGFNAALKASVIGVIIGLLTILISKIIETSRAASEFSRSMDEAEKSATSFTEEAGKEISELDKLFGKLQGAKKGTKDYNDAKEAIISRYSVYLKGLVNEKGEIENLALAYNRLTWAANKSAQARGIDAAKKAVTETFFKESDEKTEEIRKTLIERGMGEQQVTRIVTSIVQAMASGQDVPVEIRNELKAFENANRSVVADMFTDRKSPLGMVHKLRDSQQVYLQRSAKLDAMDTRYFSSVDSEELTKQVKAIEEALASPSPSNAVNVSISMDGEDAARRVKSIFNEQSRTYSPKEQGVSLQTPHKDSRSTLDSYNPYTVEDTLSVAKDANGTASVSGYVSRSGAENLLRELTYELQQRGLPQSTSNTDLNTDSSSTTSPANTTSGSKDRFEEEKAWRAREEADARIAYAKGETTYSEHNEMMAMIATAYHQKLLDREDLTADERLSIQADYWESVNKVLVSGYKSEEAEENEYYEEILASLNRQYAERLESAELSADERKAAEKVHQEAMERAELEHLKRLVLIYESGSDDYLKAQKKLQDAELAAARRHQQEFEALEAEFARIKKDYFGNNADEDKALYDKHLANLRIVYERELLAARDNASEKLRIEKAYLEAQAALRKMYNQDSEAASRNSLQSAVESSVEWLNSDGGKAVTQSFSTVVSGMSSVFSGLSTMIQSEIQIQTAAIESRYDKEITAAEGNSYRVAKLEKQKEAEIAKVKNEANRKMFAMQVIQAVAQTATNALNAYGSAAAIPVVGHIMAPIAAAMAVAAGMVQVASIKKQQQASETQGYSKGGFTRPGAVDEPAGIVHAGEWVASQKLLASPVARPMIEALDYAQRTNTIGLLRSEDVSRSITAPQTISRIADGNPSAALMAAAMESNAGAIGRLVRRLEEPFVTVNTVSGDAGLKRAQDEYTKLMNNKSPKSRRKSYANNY